MDVIECLPLTGSPPGPEWAANPSGICKVPALACGVGGAAAVTLQCQWLSHSPSLLLLLLSDSLLLSPLFTSSTFQPVASHSFRPSPTTFFNTNSVAHSHRTTNAFIASPGLLTTSSSTIQSKHRQNALLLRLRRSGLRRLGRRPDPRLRSHLHPQGWR